MDEIEEYNPPQTIYYNYIAKDFLVKDSDIIADTDEYSRIELCVYSVNTDGKYPFLQFLLTNNGFNNLIMPILPVYSTFSKDNLQSYSKVFLSGLLQAENFEQFNSEIVFDGFYEFQNTLYLFFNVTKCTLNLDDTYSDSYIRFALSDEIINRRAVCNIPVDNCVYEFFSLNYSLNLLCNDKKETYEIPIVGYVGKSTPEKLNFTYTFGETAKNKCALFGSHYYFTDFFNAIRQGGWSQNYKPEHIYNKMITDNENGRYLRGGIVRFALFPGTIKYIENMPNDPIDKSEIRQQMLNDSSLNRNYEMQLLRISDHDGLWTSNYDSVYLANIELDDGSYIKDTPAIVLKEYNQQVPLSYHFINKSKLGYKFEKSNTEYAIV